MLTDRVALITGAGGGIGAETARVFASVGIKVVCADLAVEAAEKVAEEIRASGVAAEAVAVDVSSKEQVEALVARIVKTYNRLDILVNNAGITRDALAMRMSEDQWDLVLKINLKGTWLPCQAVIRPMRKLRWGRIVNTSSIAAHGNAGQANYSASKGGVESLTRTLALELAGSGINVNCVAPGAIMTPMLEKVPEDLRAKFLERIPIGRFGTPTDVAQAQLFLCCAGADYITGQVISVDGGMSIGS